MAQPKRVSHILEGTALAIVVLFPLVAIGWYLSTGGSTPDTTTASVATSPTNQQSATPVTVSPSVAASAVLILDDESSLPQTVAAAQIVPFSFTIENPGSVAASFPYKVYVVWKSGEEDVIDENSVTLAAGASTELAESLKFETAGATGEVYIEIQPSGPSIHFAMPRE